MTITPDTKDWTWVLERRCPECGFDARTVVPSSVGDRLRDNASSWQRVLAEPDAVRTRPQPDVWSPLEYACHVRDVYRLYLTRLDLMLAETDPLFPNWDQDETALAEQYDGQDPTEVRVDLNRAAEQLAATFDGVAGEQWDRTGRRSDGASFTIESFSRYLLHDVVHHLHDVTAG